MLLCIVALYNAASYDRFIFWFRAGVCISVIPYAISSVTCLSVLSHTDQSLFLVDINIQ